jgi:hypothetical protein
MNYRRRKRSLTGSYGCLMLSEITTVLTSHGTKICQRGIFGRSECKLHECSTVGEIHDKATIARIRKLRSNSGRIGCKKALLERPWTRTNRSQYVSIQCIGSLSSARVVGPMDGLKFDQPSERNRDSISALKRKFKAIMLNNGRYFSEDIQSEQKDLVFSGFERVYCSSGTSDFHLIDQIPTR